MSPLIAGPGGEVLFLLVVPFLAAMGGYFLGYASHSLLVVIEQTGAGADAVHWPDEGIRDWLWKTYYLAWLLLLWVVPFGLAYAWLQTGPAGAAQGALPLLGLLFFWLVWPISLLSSLSSVSGWAWLRWEILRQLPRCWRPWAVFYALTAPLLAGTMGLLWLVLVGWRLVQELADNSNVAVMPDLVVLASYVLFLPLAGPIGATALLLYARLLGRLAFLIRLAQRHEAEAAEEEEVQQAAQEPAPAAATTAVATAGAAAASAERSEEAGGLRKPETFVLAEEAPAAPPVGVPFRWQPGRKPPPRPPRSQWRDQPGWSGPVDPTDLNPATTSPTSVAPLLTRSVFLFPWYRTSLQAWLWLTVGVACVIGIVRLLLAFEFV